MATQLSLVNSLLRRLREDTVTSVADNAYSQLLALFINEGLDEINDAYDWSAYRSTIDVTVTSGTYTYDLSTTNPESLLRFDAAGRPLCFLFDDGSDTQGRQMFLVTQDEMDRRFQLDRDETNDEPSLFSLPYAADGDNYTLQIWPTPSANRLIRITFNTPQQELAIDGTADSTDIVPPNKAILAYALMMAANERGEEIGEPGGLLERRYQRALGGAIEAAMSADQRTNRYESWRD